MSLVQTLISLRSSINALQMGDINLPPLLLPPVDIHRLLRGQIGEPHFVIVQPEIRIKLVLHIMRVVQVRKPWVVRSHSELSHLHL